MAIARFTLTISFLLVTYAAAVNSQPIATADRGSTTKPAVSAPAHVAASTSGAHKQAAAVQNANPKDAPAPVQPLGAPQQSACAAAPAQSVWKEFTWIASPITVLISAVAGWFAAILTIRHQRKQRDKDDAAKKALVFQLLRDEITSRWGGKIGPHLRGLLRHLPVAGLHLLSTIKLKGEDVFTFKAVSASFTEYFFIDNPRLLSQIVHGYLAVCDLIDFRDHVAGMLSKRSAAYQQLKVRGFTEENAQQRLQQQYQQYMDDLWKQFPERLDAIDALFNEILPNLSLLQNETAGRIYCEIFGKRGKSKRSPEGAKRSG